MMCLRRSWKVIYSVFPRKSRAALLFAFWTQLCLTKSEFCTLDFCWSWAETACLFHVTAQGQYCTGQVWCGEAQHSFQGEFSSKCSHNVHLQRAVLRHSLLPCTREMEHPLGEAAERPQFYKCVFHLNPLLKCSQPYWISALAPLFH